MCGYNNGITIGMIGDEDITLMEGEVRKESVTAEFDSKTFLEGSTKNKANFEFSMGHRKFLKFIVNFLKTYSAEHGFNKFTSERFNKRLKCKRKLESTDASHTKKKLKHSVIGSTEIPTRDSVAVEKNKLLTKAITSLINYSPEMYVKACVKVNIVLL